MSSLPAHAKLIKLADDIHETCDKAMKAVVLACWNAGKRSAQDEEDADVRAVYGSGLLKELSYMLTERHGRGYSGESLERMRAFYLENGTSPSDETAGWTLHVELFPTRDETKSGAVEKISLRECLTQKDVQTLVRKKTLETKLPPLKRPTDLRLGTYRNINSKAADLNYKMGEGEVLLDCGFFACRVVSETEAAGVTITDTPSYAYAAFVERVIDGDTLLVLIDLGFRNPVRERLRLRGVDTPEVGTPEGEAAKAFVEKLLPPGMPLVIKSNQTDDYGRFVADVFYFGKDSSQNTLRSRGDQQGARAEEYLNGDPTPEEIVAGGTYLNQQLLDEGLAVRMQG